MNQKITEQSNPKSLHLDEMSTIDILQLMNEEDQRLTTIIGQHLHEIERVIALTTKVYQNGGKVIYIGAGTSGRLGVLDAAELIPTFNADPNRYFGLIAGGFEAMTRAIEGAEDLKTQGAQDLKNVNLTSQDVVIGIAASGSTPYVLGALTYAQNIQCHTVALSCNHNTPISKHADIPIEIAVGPEIVTGSTRLKAGSVQKMILNMISTITMVRVGKVYNNLMIDVQATNDKLIDRALHMIQMITGLDTLESKALYEAAHHQVKTAIVMHFKEMRFDDAEHCLKLHHGVVKDVLKSKNL
ncbi:N-acetylmuramic acid 6-phosphate etherase [Staphylococcus agnetis]|uniref:N-acetylmuramic acid 6-phosphate etherase n=1 Tax=Staphylococcus agnetis TaxID=985762 RepID=UPI000CD27A2E|nr:N-acetylmuramic acid 6-phosphate etherase [Staphylococcus agnetis]MBY7663438.1 N-acetylmuramic acid 6-phosphate etherase [Staphylococcus agnetis]NJH66937.1 N-acetylmuramic acid 6-phosphate etherase [Staphylococcus agnetis]NJH80070.1 N-acetylmuramic acid 6-phosphate etherase [Staphylococcus agnetis]PNY86900.1 N-acetylmuramic acid 6-phosphate etherase [Staphylococcus agnetis]PTH67609.1 N-acetylmuramic acid 6-phosphate etherase [Staphylococcus agnetis]